MEHHQRCLPLLGLHRGRRSGGTDSAIAAGVHAKRSRSLGLGRGPRSGFSELFPKHLFNKK
jgi:hypothetical protein